MAFSSDGTKMFVIGSQKDNVNEYTLSTPFDASTRKFVDATSVSEQEVNPRGIAFSNDGTRMFVIGSTGDDVNEYALSSVYPVTVTRTPPTFDSSVLDLDAEVLTITFSETIDAANIVPTKIHIRESGNYTHGTTLSTGELVTVDDGSTISFTLTMPHLAAVAGLITPELTIEPGAVRDESGNLIVGTFDASTRTLVNATDISSKETLPTDMAFSSDGTKMFVIGPNRGVNEYDLSTPFDASTLSFNSSTPISAQETNPRGMAFSSDGTKMFVIGFDGKDVNEYDLSAPFDTSTRTFVDATSVSGQENNPQGIAFSNDGTKMFVIGITGDDVNEYTLSAPFDASTKTFVNATSISSQENEPRDIAFSNDGTKMFVIGTAGKDVNEYTLSTPFNASTLSFVDATRIRSQERVQTGMAFSSDGTKMFVIGSNKDNVNEYALSSVYPITVTGTPTLPAGAFVTTWNVAASPYTVSIHVEVRTDGTLTMDWGDGTAAEVTTNGTQPHTYSASDEYQVSMTGDLSRIILDATGGTPSKLASIDQWGYIEWSSMEGAFREASNMKYKAADAPDLSHVTSMQNMFRDASSFNGNLSDWNVSTVTNMDGTFRGASDFNGDVSSWDTSSATDMRNMFQDADNFDGDISGWDVSKVTDTSSMFYEASDFNQPLNGWDVSKVTDTSSMFYEASDFNQPLNGWDVSKVTDMSFMFDDADSFNQPLNGWDVSKVTDMSFMFFGTAFFDGDLTGWDVSKVTDMSSMFDSADSFNQPLNGWDVSSVTEMNSMFASADSFNRPLNSWNVSAVTDMFAMFRSTDFFDGDISGWDVSKVTDMSRMFSGAFSFNGDISGWDVSKVTNMDSMFSSVTDFKQNLGKWYVTLDPDTIANTGIPGVVGTISAQNQPLRDHVPTYDIVDGLDKNHFEIVSGNQLNMTSGVPGEYSINVTASGDNVFESDNNWRVLEIEVTGQTSDTMAPVIMLTGLTSIQLTVDDTYMEEGAVCDDDVDADKPATVGGDTVDTSTVGQYTVTYDCTDTAGNVATQVSRTVNVQDVPDTDAPVIMLTGLTSIQLTVDDTYMEEGAVCDDDVDADKPATVGGDTVDTSTVGQYTVTYDCTDTAGNVATQVSRTVNVQDAPDTDAPVIMLTGLTSIQLTVDDTYMEEGAVCDDDVDADKPATVGGDTVDTSTVGQYTVTYDCTDTAGNVATQVSRTVNVQDAPDTDAPVIMLTGLTSIQLTVDDTYMEEGAVCDDDVDADKPATVGGDTVDTSTVGQYTVTYDCTDTAGNVATQVSRTVIVQAESDTPTPVTPTPDTTTAGSKKKPSSPPIITDIYALTQSRLVDIPLHITEQVASHDASDPLEPITPDGTFDFPLVINGYGYLLDDVTNTLVPQILTVGDDDPTIITFTVYTQKDLAYFTLYLNLSDENIDYADSDTYITYKDDGTTSVTDPHGYIGSATVTVTQEDDQIPEKRTVRITIEFGEEPMGPTNMVAYMWNTDRKATFIKIIDAIEVVVAPLEPVMQAADPEPLEPDSELPADPEPVAPDFADDAADPEPVSSDMLWPDDYDEAQVLHIIRMWSGFESEFITDTQLLELLGLEDYQDVDLPDWMMTELGVLVARGDVTVDEFMLALQYVLEHA